MRHLTRNYRFLIIGLLALLGIGLLLTGLALTAHAGPKAAPLLGADIAAAAITTPGETLAYTATVNNPQSFSVSADVSLPLPAQIAYTGGLTYSLGAANYKTATRSVVWSGVIPASQTLQLSYRGTVSNPLRHNTVITGVVKVNDYFNPVYSDTTTTTVHSEPDMSPSWKTVTPTTVITPGQVVTVALRLENMGTSDTHVYVTETVPACFTLGDVSVETIIIGPDYINWDFDLAASGVHTLTYQATAKASCFGSGPLQAAFRSQVNDSFHPVFVLSGDLQSGQEQVYLPVILKGGTTPTCDTAEPNNAFAQATAMTTTSRQVLSYDADEDYLTFEITQPATYTLQTGALGLDTDTLLYLFDQSQTLLGWNDDAGAGTLWSQVGPLYLNAGQYYLKVEDYNPRQYDCDHVYTVEVK